ncbi:MAG: Zn-ribbon domain-containing OB-fold protein, partial [Dehalococcoidia bacterium]
TRGEDYLNGSRCKSCGVLYVGPRRYCGKCSTEGPFDEVKLSKDGEVHVWSIIHQSRPGIPTPYIAAVVDLPEGVSVLSNIEGVEPAPENMKFGMKVAMYTETVSEDREGNSYVAYKFKPV